MKRLNVVVCCEQSQAVCKAFRALGHNAYSCDLAACYGGYPSWHFQSDCFNLFSPGSTLATESGELVVLPAWDIAILHPPCTYLSKAGASRLYHGCHIDSLRYSRGLAAASFFKRCLSVPVAHVAVENPTPLSIFGLPPASDCIEPYYFGDPYRKRTLLWLRGLPPLLPTRCVQPVCSWVSSSRTHGVARSARLRSCTFAGVASAMASQWSHYLECCHV